MAPTISAVINTLNEEKNLPLALGSVRPWVDEIIVVDMYSDDRTVEIARDFGARVFSHERVGFADSARAFALEQASGDWILILDADEVVPRPLSERLRNIACSNSTDVVRIPWLNYLLGAPLMHTSWGPEQDTHLRFFKKDCVRATSDLHNYLHPVAGARVLKLWFEPGLAIVHFNYVDSQHFIEKLNRYTTIEANQLFERGERITPVGALARGIWEFGRRYIKDGGWRDGWRGFYLSLFMVFYRIATAAKCEELQKMGSRESIENLYQGEAKRVLQEYEAGVTDGRTR